MDYYNTVPSGPSSRPYNHSDAIPTTSYSGPSSDGASGDSPRYSPYGLMTDLPPVNSNSASAPGPTQTHPASDPSTVASVDHEMEIDDSAPLVEANQDLDTFLESFWTRQMGMVERDNPDFRTYPLPLARIKKVMKSDEDVKMISAEVPIMFSKACEVFISELTCRAWLVAETSKRRTLQKADVANAIAHSDMFDFLIDIIPRDDGSGGTTGAGAGTGAGDMDNNTGEADVAGGEDEPVQEQEQGHEQGQDGAVGTMGYDDLPAQETMRTQEEQDEDDRVFTEFVRDDDD